MSFSSNNWWAKSNISKHIPIKKFYKATKQEYEPTASQKKKSKSKSKIDTTTELTHKTQHSPVMYKTQELI